MCSPQSTGKSTPVSALAAPVVLAPLASTTTLPA
jgi:hypothetical protein